MSQHKAARFTEDNFESEVLSTSGPVLVDFWAGWCGPCRVVGPIVEQLAGEYEGKARVGKVNVDEEPRLAAEYDIHAIPALLLFKDGQLVDRIVGARPKGAIASKLDELVAA